MTDMGLCKDCCWWDSSPGRSIGECLLTRSPTLSEEPDGLTTSKARVSYSEDAEHILETDADFGCVQFHARASPADDKNSRNAEQKGEELAEAFVDWLSGRPLDDTLHRRDERGERRVGLKIGDRVKLADSRHHNRYGYGTILGREPAIDPEDGSTLTGIDSLAICFDDGHEEAFWHTELELVPHDSSDDATSDRRGGRDDTEAKGEFQIEPFVEWLIYELTQNTGRRGG